MPNVGERGARALHIDGAGPAAVGRCGAARAAAVAGAEGRSGADDDDATDDQAGDAAEAGTVHRAAP